MNVMASSLMTAVACLFIGGAVDAGNRPTTPIMGWSSWNNFRINISEQMIREQADAMATNGMKDAGYQFINIDDGYFGGRDEEGRLISHPEKFPSGMKTLADYIHGKGLKAGIYTDAGADTCASQYDQDEYGIGVGLHGHDREDLQQMLLDWGYDFIKIDWGGAKKLKMIERRRYSHLSTLIRDIKPACVFNVCCWRFPGEWVVDVADSWRISGDIGPHWDSIIRIIDRNADLWKYAGPGHFNDMDMLQVGRGMPANEDRVHFTMWCMMNSPLLAGNDLRDMSQQTLEILTNREVIALNQDPLGYQARRIEKEGSLELWHKHLQRMDSGEVAVAILNREAAPGGYTLHLDQVGIDPGKGYAVRDLWAHEMRENLTAPNLTYTIPGRSVLVLKISGTGE